MIEEESRGHVIREVGSLELTKLRSYHIDWIPDLVRNDEGDRSVIERNDGRWMPVVERADGDRPQWVGVTGSIIWEWQRPASRMD